MGRAGAAAPARERGMCLSASELGDGGRAYPIYRKSQN